MNELSKLNTKDRILNASIDLISQKGFSGVSIREITRAVGIKESSLYNHFKTKDEILDVIFIQFIEEFSKTVPPVEMLDAILENLGLEQFFEKGFENFKKHIDQPLNEKYWRILYIEHYRCKKIRDIFLQDIIKFTLDFLEIVFEKLIAKKMIKPLEARFLASEYQYPMFSMLAEYNMLRFDQLDTSEIENLMKKHMRFFIDNVRL
ncbi:TetR/AcrR family transcriptional regulator [Bacillus sp. CGMCC 1.16607]|uniref:TetR/AcrR family transcriptional regulator n=1 Tax=Bacillus sp. CGMCC 1.16607 TaxID=3351842 RepID=UPI003638FF7D